MSTKKEKCMVQIPSYDDDGEEKDVDYWFCCLKDMPCPDHSQSEMELVYCKVCHKDHALRKGELPCHQTESIEWEKDLSFRFDTWLKLYPGNPGNPGTPTIGEIEEWWLESLRISITTALAKREMEIADELQDLPNRTVSIGRVLQIIQH